jgi:hypothetical protein
MSMMAIVDHGFIGSHAIVYFRVRARHAPRDVIVALGSHASIEVATALVDWFRQDIIVVVAEDAGGSTTAGCTGGDEIVLAAEAVAVVKAGAGWDESNPVHVDLDGRCFQIAVAFEAGAWAAAPIDRGRASSE